MVSVTFTDFLIFSSNFGDPAKGTVYTNGDIDLNGEIAFPDFLVLSSNFGVSLRGAQSVPEPHSFALLSLAMLVGSRIRRRRSV